MDKRQQETVQRYADLLANKNVDLAVAVGRFSEHLGMAQAIWEDITKKLDLKPNAKMLDIGCGFGEVTEFCLETARNMNLKLHLMDIPEAIDRIRKDMSHKLPSSVVFIEGVYPQAIEQSTFSNSFDAVLAYSVLHYTDQPEIFIEHAVSLLKEGGKLLLGDLPNVNKKGRFLSSIAGRVFEAEYRRVELEEVPLYKDHHDFFERCNNQNKMINDGLIENTIKKYRQLGYHVYVLPQSDKLPFSYTREDVLICRP